MKKRYTKKQALKILKDAKKLLESLTPTMQDMSEWDAEIVDDQQRAIEHIEFCIGDIESNRV